MTLCFINYTLNFKFNTYQIVFWRSLFLFFYFILCYNRIIQIYDIDKLIYYIHIVLIVIELV